MKKWIIAAAGIGLSLAGLYYYTHKPTPPPVQLKLASFNIQTFGKAKCEKAEIMDILTKTIKNFDLVAVQEIKDATVLPLLVDKINETSEEKYTFLASERVGRTVSKEQYGFLYKRDKVHFTGKSYLYNDKDDAFEREPFVAQFKSNGFDFILANIHTKPAAAKQEIQSLVDVVNNASTRFTDDKDVIVLGDYNADGAYFSEKTTTGLRGALYFWAISDDADTTVATSEHTYDRIVFQKKYTLEDFTGKVGVFKFDEEYALPKNVAKQVSDHYPVWSTFYTDKDTD